MVHQFTDQQDSVSTPFFLFKLVLHGWQTVAVGIKGLPLIQYGDQHFLPAHTQLNVDRFALLPPVGMLDDVGAGLVHGQDDIVDVVIAEPEISGMIRDKMPNPFQFIGGCADSQGMFRYFRQCAEINGLWWGILRTGLRLEPGYGFLFFVYNIVQGRKAQ